MFDFEVNKLHYPGIGGSRGGGGGLCLFCLKGLCIKDIYFFGLSCGPLEYMNITSIASSRTILFVHKTLKFLSVFEGYLIFAIIPLRKDRGYYICSLRVDIYV